MSLSIVQNDVDLGKEEHGAVHLDGFGLGDVDHFIGDTREEAADAVHETIGWDAALSVGVARKSFGFDSVEEAVVERGEEDGGRMAGEMTLWFVAVFAKERGGGEGSYEGA